MSKTHATQVPFRPEPRVRRQVLMRSIGVALEPAVMVDGDQATSSPASPDAVAPSAQTRRHQLEERKADVQKRMRSKANDFRVGSGFLVGLGALAAFFIALAYYFEAIPAPIAVGVAVLLMAVALLFFAMSVPYGRRQDEVELFDIEQQMDLLAFDDASQEQRAERLFKLHQVELNKYYNIAARQSVQIFYVGVLCIAVGLALFVAAFVAVTTTLGSQGLQERIVVGAVGGVGAILANFIGTIFLRMYSGTITSLADFHGRLVGTHHLHYGSFLAAKIGDQDLRGQTLASMAINASKTVASEEEEGPA